MTRLITLVEAIGTYSNPGSVREKWADLRKRLREAPIRPPLSRDDSLPPRSKRLLGADDIADITARYDSGASTKQIADHYRVSKSRVSDLLRTQGVTLRRLGLTTDQVREAPILYAAGRSLAWLGVRYGVSPTTVSRALRGQGSSFGRDRADCNPRRSMEYTNRACTSCGMCQSTWARGVIMSDPPFVYPSSVC